ASQRDFERGARRARRAGNVAFEDRARPQRSRHRALRRVPTERGTSAAPLGFSLQESACVSNTTRIAVGSMRLQGSASVTAGDRVLPLLAGNRRERGERLSGTVLITSLGASQLKAFRKI